MIESSLRPFLNLLLHIHHSNIHPTPPSTLKVRAYQRETKSRREEKRFGGLILICDTPRTKLSGSNESSLRLFLNILLYIHHSNTVPTPALKRAWCINDRTKINIEDNNEEITRSSLVPIQDPINTKYHPIFLNNSSYESPSVLEYITLYSSFEYLLYS